jgi:hypothetical protein
MLFPVGGLGNRNKETRMDNIGEESNDNIKFFQLMLDVGLGCDTPICQYMDIDYLNALLSTQKYYVKRKKLFVDKREKRVPNYLRFGLLPYGATLNSEEKQLQQSRDNAIVRFEKVLSSLLTSCWTERITENSLMWDRGGEKHKACIISTVGDFVDAFEKLEFDIWCGKMIYAPIHSLLLSEDVIWYKEPYFSDEREVRFYFSKGINKVIPDDESVDGKFLSVKIDKLIHEIVLSPYINKIAAEKIKKNIFETYHIKTSLSNIEIQ